MSKSANQRNYLFSVASLVLAFSIVGYSLSIGTAHAPAPPERRPSVETPVPASQTQRTRTNVSETIRPVTQQPPASLPQGHPNYTYYAQIAPVGPLYSNAAEPFLPRIAAQSGWTSVAAVTAAPVIAVIDTGFALGHVDLAGRLVPGWDFVHNDSDPSAGTDNPSGASVFHGTMTAGLAALLNPGAKIMPLQALGDDGVGSTDTVAAAVRYAADNGANVISLSLGSSSDDAYLQEQIDYAIGRGTLVVAAAGNGGCNCMLYPANYPEVLAVGATDSRNVRAAFSSYGANLDVMAPGTAGDVCSATYTTGNPTTAYTCAYSGTSFSTPITAGLASLMLNQDPQASPDDLTRFIDSETSRVSGMGGQLPSLQYGFGLINVFNSVIAASLASPRGEILNKHTLSLSSADPYAGPEMESTCQSIPGAACHLTLRGPGGANIDLGSQTLDSTGVAVFDWNASDLGLSSGAWQILATLTDFGETTVTGPFSFTVTP